MMLHGIQKLKNNCLTEGARLADGMPIIWKRRIPSSQDISRLRLCCGKLKMDDGFVTFHPNGIHIDLGICKTWQDMNSLAALGVWRMFADKEKGYAMCKAYWITWHQYASWEISVLLQVHTHMYMYMSVYVHIQKCIDIFFFSFGLLWLASRLESCKFRRLNLQNPCWPNVQICIYIYVWIYVYIYMYV